MDYVIMIALALALISISPLLYAKDATKPVIHVFHKNKAPSLKALEKINAALNNYKTDYDILYLDIEDQTNLELIHSFGLPSTHFPVAVVIDGKFTIQREDNIISFVHFPAFMRGIGRHEGNWSIADLEATLVDMSLLCNKNILPVLEDEESEGKCE